VTRRIALALVVAGAIGIVVAIVLVVRGGGSGSTARPPALALHARPSVAPFAGLTEARIGVGGRCLRVVIADDEAERVEGLRGRRDLGPYDGMLFVYRAPTEVSFTMSTVPVPLDIGFYSAGGDPVARLHMRPCPRAEAECPTYSAGAPFTYALETLRGGLPKGGLSGCN